MDQLKKDTDYLIRSLDGHMTCLQLGRWLSTLPTVILMELMALSLPTAKPSSQILRLVRTFMVAESIMRPGEIEPPLDFYARRLGECASAEYAYRRDWVVLSDRLSLTKHPRSCVVPTRTGRMMKQVTGPDALITAMVSA